VSYHQADVVVRGFLRLVGSGICSASLINCRLISSRTGRRPGGEQGSGQDSNQSYAEQSFDRFQEKARGVGLVGWVTL
jgi:hypothetical protein